MKEVLLPRDYNEGEKADDKQGRKYFEMTAGFQSIQPRTEPWGALKKQVSRDWNEALSRSNELTDLEADIELAINQNLKTTAHTHVASDISGLSGVTSLPSTAGYYEGQVLTVGADGSWVIDWVRSHP